ncbi:MAG: hypothetical protein HY226_06635 [Candidatus Vogelbacteria bacterium]|nr:hypothetical protein [Candidatus Vogelbacteria bacterium]
MSVFARMKRMVKSRVNGIFDTTSSSEPSPWTNPSPENVHKRPLPETSKDSLFEDVQNSMTLDRRLADELYNVMTMDDALPWLMNLSRLLEKRSEGEVDRLSNNDIRGIVKGVDGYVSKLLSSQPGDPSVSRLQISVGFDSVGFSINNERINKDEMVGFVESKSGVSKSVASWWTEMTLLLLPLHKNVLPQVLVTTESGKYVLLSKETSKENKG